MSSSDPQEVLADGDLLVLYRNNGRGGSALTIFSSDPQRNLAAALGAINQMPIEGRHVRFRAAERQNPAYLIINYRDELDGEDRLRHGRAYVDAIKRSA